MANGAAPDQPKEPDKKQGFIAQPTLNLSRHPSYCDGNFEGRHIDLRDEGSVADFFRDVGGFDHLAITAGDSVGRMFVPSGELDLTQAREVLTVRFWGVLAAVKHCCETIAPSGSITLTSGMLAHRPRKGAPLATAVGGAVESLARGR